MGIKDGLDTVVQNGNSFSGQACIDFLDAPFRVELVGSIGVFQFLNDSYPGFRRRIDVNKVGCFRTIFSNVMVKLYRFFGGTVPQESGRPTNYAFIARIANEVKRRTEEV